MSGFQKYLHLERYGTDGVDGITIGQCHIFPKLDGTNASFWYEQGQWFYASRNRQLHIHEDNAGFMNWAITQDKLTQLAKDYPEHRFYGEWLVPHSVKGYRDDAWRNLYIFDVMKPDGASSSKIVELISFLVSARLPTQAMNSSSSLYKKTNI